MAVPEQATGGGVNNQLMGAVRGQETGEGDNSGCNNQIIGAVPDQGTGGRQQPTNWGCTRKTDMGG